MVAVERGLGSGSCLGNSSSLLPAAHCTSAFPSTKANSQSWAGAQGWSKITCMAQSLCQPICQPRPISSALPHILPFQHCHGRADTQPVNTEGHQRCSCQSLVASRELWSSGLQMGWPGTPESPSPRTGLISRQPLHSQKRSESTTEAELRGNFQSPLPTSCLPGPLH